MRIYNNYVLIKNQLYFLAGSIKEVIEVLKGEITNFSPSLAHITKDDILILEVAYYKYQPVIVMYSVKNDEFTFKLVRNPESYITNHFYDVPLKINKTLKKKIEEVIEIIEEEGRKELRGETK